MAGFTLNKQASEQEPLREFLATIREELKRTAIQQAARYTIVEVALSQNSEANRRRDYPRAKFIDISKIKVNNLFTELKESQNDKKRRQT